MVEKMSKFSRRFISLNSLEQILKRNKAKRTSKALRLWSRLTSSSEDTSEVTDLRK